MKTLKRIAIVGVFLVGSCIFCISKLPNNPKNLTEKTKPAERFLHPKDGYMYGGDNELWYSVKSVSSTMGGIRLSVNIENKSKLPQIVEPHSLLIRDESNAIYLPEGDVTVYVSTGANDVGEEKPFTARVPLNPGSTAFVILSYRTPDKSKFFLPIGNGTSYVLDMAVEQKRE